MLNTADLPDTIAIFPLPGALLLPRTRLPLHVFEPRYLAMLEDVMKTPHRLIGMIQPHTEDDSTLHGIGCAGRLTQFSETEDGRYMITLAGVSRFQMLEEIDGFTPYRRAKVEWSAYEEDLQTEAQEDPALDRPHFLGLLRRYFSEQELQTDWDELADAGDEMLIDALSMLCPFHPEDKQALLEAFDLPERRRILIALIEFSLRGGDDEERIRQ
ncbi:hypothetical protein SAMN05421688_2696 [Poseidonocella pacifica]|uniref:Lon N-terminal domain-containing protein n=1 Tax=Poseidonocella pacifica TaxID=871651 RepID=A0A1I0Y018_9RHOB|nr:LON peptidase substrate-binding domain-containing protein [Poseidonocella pacifica]SFB06661.1 hypothetical protein SAMN05421688_2696 [Poseidonocella pacifica]